MPKIITVNSMKGGVSKSTLALNLYYYYTRNGYGCGLIDADPQGSLSEELGDREDVALLPRADISDWPMVRELADGDYIIIDTAPTRDEKETMNILAISDFVLMPCKASVFDVRALNKTIGYYETVRQENSSLRAAIVLTQGKVGTVINTQLRGAAENYGIPVLATEMMSRVDYQSSLSETSGVFSTNNTKAKQEIQSIGIEIKNILGNGRA